MNRLVTFAVAVLSISITTGYSQTQPVEMVTTCNEEFARFLVDQQVSESRSVEQTDKRIRILIRAAEFLWKYDQPTAREYFGEAFKVANDRFNEKGFEKVQKQGFTTLLPDYRFEVIRSISSKDKVWAAKLIEQVLKEYEKASERKDIDKTRELNDILRLAQESLKTNPELSRALFRRVMALPLDYHWFFALSAIAGENRAFADTLYGELLTTYANATPRRLLFLSAYPFAGDRLIGPDKYQYGASVPDGFTPNPLLQRRFIETLIRRSITFANDPENLNLEPEPNRLPEPVYLAAALNELELTVTQKFPQLIPQFSEAKARANAMLTEQMRKDATDREKQQENVASTFDQLLKEVEEADANGKLTDQMIVRLLISGGKRTEEQFGKIEPWLDKITDESGRVETVNYFWFLRSQLAVDEKRLDDAERFSQKVPEIEHRAMLVLQIAGAQMKSINDRASTYQTLREVGRLAERSETSVEKARVQLALVNMYIEVDRISAMQQLAEAINVINRLEDPTAVMSTIVTRQIRVTGFSLYASFGLPGQNLEGTFKAISRDNFEMSLSNAKSLEDKYLRTLAVLAVAQNCVDKVKKPANTRKPAKSTN